MLKGVSTYRIRIWSILNQRRLFSSNYTRKTLPTSERDRPLPPRKPVSANAAYLRERYMYKQPGEKLSMAIIAREWREMDPQRLSEKAGGVPEANGGVFKEFC